MKDIVSGRPTYNQFSIEQEIALGEYSIGGQIILSKLNGWEINPKQYKKELQQIQDIVRRIGSVSDFPFFPYVAILINNPESNAFCTPGGKIGVNTGLWNPNDGLVEKGNAAQLAAVLAHEIAHANARHTTERISSQQLYQAIGLGIASGIAQSGYQDWAQFFYDIWGGLYPQYTHKQEYEADKIGLMYMAKAGYDPNEAVAMWKKMAVKHVNDRNNISYSHPPDGARAAYLETLLPKALALYEASPYKSKSSRIAGHIQPEQPKTPFLEQFTQGSYSIMNDTCQSGIVGSYVVAPIEEYNKLLIKFLRDQSLHAKTSQERAQYKKALNNFLKGHEPGKSMDDEYIFYLPDSPQHGFYAKVDSDGEVNISDNKYVSKFVCGGVFKKSNKFKKARFGCAPLVPNLSRCTFTLVHTVN